MGWDVVEIGLRHNLPVEDPVATAKVVAKRLNHNVKLVARNKYDYDAETNTVSTANGDEYINLGEFNVNDASGIIQMTVSNYQAKAILEQVGKEKLLKANFADRRSEWIIYDIENEYQLYELENEDENENYIYIKIFKENVDLDVYVMGRWSLWESAFHKGSPYKEWLSEYREKIHERALAFGCSEVIICSDQGYTQALYYHADWPADKLKEYTLSYEYLQDCDYSGDIGDWIKKARQVYFADYFADRLKFDNKEFVEVIFDDFNDLK